jgi:hypothetical protein
MFDPPHSPRTACPEHDPFPELALDRRVDPMILWGAWPGEETVKELMALLD